MRETLKRFARDNGYGRIDRFEVVTKIPKGYQIWNIPEMQGYENYIPLCEVYEGTCNVKLDTLKAILVSKDDANIIRKATNWGFADLKSVRRYLKNQRNNNKRGLAEKVLPIYEELTCE